MRNCQANSSFISIDSDHRIVSCITCLSLRSSKRPDTNPMKTIDLEAGLLKIKHLSSIRHWCEKPLRCSFKARRRISRQSTIMILPSVRRRSLYQLCSKGRSRAWVPTPWLRKHKRLYVIAARKQHQDKPPKASLRNVSQAQRQLDEAYANAEAKNIQGKIDWVPPKKCSPPACLCIGYYQRPYWTEEQTIDSYKRGLEVGKEKELARPL